MNYILVTGCNGFIGKKLTGELLCKGYKVIGISTGENTLDSHKNFRYHQIDLTDSISVEKLFDTYNISSVIHLAAIAHLKGRKDIDWNEFYRVNVLASKTVFQCAINANAKIFYASTVDVYGELNTEEISENANPHPLSDYAKSKYIAEEILKEMASENNIDYCIARFAPVYGKKFMKDVYKRIYLHYPSLAFLIEDGYNYHFVSVNNVIEFIIHWASEKDNMVGTFNVCDPELINSKEFITHEQKLDNSKKVIKLNRKMFIPLTVSLETIYWLTKSAKINKIRKNLYKLISPPRYSTQKMNEVVSPKWNLKNTIYDDIN